MRKVPCARGISCRAAKHGYVAHNRIERGGIAMPIGDSYSIGEEAPVTGRYKCSNCGNTIIVNKGERLPPCGKCKRPGIRWILVAILT